MLKLINILNETDLLLNKLARGIKFDNKYIILIMERFIHVKWTKYEPKDFNN
jgi:hypothetical protein